jgi:hypothetical protein
MTPDQWEFINANLNSIKVLLFALAKTSPDAAALRKIFRQERESLETALLNTQSSDTSIDLQRKKMDEIEIVLWG